jgi:ATP-dependent helicase/nuclease subunit A
MNAPATVPADVIARQIAASDPAVSAWVSANAGSGKTHVLAQRVIRLLLDGTAPSKILCLTFTKAAAADMANRVFGTLARWTAMDDPALDAAVAVIEGRAPSAARRQRARRLFAEALETPGGLKVQTIHAFCSGLLHQFPFEADVPARFEVLDERAEQQLIDQLRLAVLREAAASMESPLGGALTVAITSAADITFSEVVQEAIRDRDKVTNWIERAGSVEAAVEELSATLKIPAGRTRESVEAEFLSDSLVPQSEWPTLIAALEAGGKTDRDHIDRLANAQAGTDWSNIECYLHVFCTTTDLAPRANVVTRAIQRDHPELFDRLVSEQRRVCGLLNLRRAILLRDRSAALIRIAHAVITRYRAEKDRRGLLDYDDLIDKTLALFANVRSAWVLYKLDLGIDHVLIDEAQDTSPKQWEVIRKLTEEFMAGEGARGGLKRSIFAVGDEKQSIYSFQGAAPQRFDEMRRHFQQAHDEAAMAFKPLEFKYSFRSGPDVLGAVDTVFAREEAFKGLTAERMPTLHEAVHSKAPGSVEIWPMIEAEKKADVEGWDRPFDAVLETSPQVLLAKRIAKNVRIWIERGDVMPATGKPVRPGDVLVLVRQRGALFEAVIRALKNERIEVAGADRLVLNDHIAVMDLISLADSLLLEEDDLALAEVLKSPLFGLEDQHLFELAWNRPSTLRAALRSKTDDLLWRSVSAQLDELAESAQAKTPFAFYADVLGADGGRRKILARLGLEAADALDEFLALALEYEQRETPSLQGFVAWLRASATEVKRDMDIARDEVRVMTVHGAKGLEAPVVILADTTTQPRGPRDPRLLQLDASGLPPDAAPPLVWAGRKDDDPPAVAAAREAARGAAEDEHRRLLYVAMTRAADRLIVCGAQGVRAKPEGCWYELVHDALQSEAQSVPADDGDGDIMRWQKFFPDEPANGKSAPAVAPETPVVRPEWLTKDVPPDPRAADALRPSAGDEGVSPYRRIGVADRRIAMLRGKLIHRLLQSLPDVPGDRRKEAARRHLARNRRELAEIDGEAVIPQVLAILDHPDFSALFVPGSRTEIPIVGRLKRSDGTTIAVSGQVDRLAVTPEAVLIADYKTDRHPPRRVEDAPSHYVRQLALYRAVLAGLYPGRITRAALVWTETPALMEIPETLMDAALSQQGVTSP